MASWRTLERELMEPRFRESMRLPYGPLRLIEQTLLEGHLGAYLDFMERTVYGDMSGPFAGELLATLRDEVDNMSPLEIVIRPGGMPSALFDAPIDVTGIDRRHAPRHVTIVTCPGGTS